MDDQKQDPVSSPVRDEDLNAWLRFEPGTALPRPEQIAGARALIVQDGCVALANIKGRGWDLPGGTAEPGEEVLETLHREVYEETGLRIVVERHVGNIMGEPADPEQPTKIRRPAVPVFLATVLESVDVPAGSEAAGMEFVPLRQAAQRFRARGWEPLVEAMLGTIDWAEKPSGPSDEH